MEVETIHRNLIELYAGIPFAEKGRDRSGLDCWGLVWLIYRDEFGIELPSYDDRYERTDDRRTVDEIVRAECGAWEAIPPGSELFGDIVVLRIAERECHIGLVLEPGIMLHCERRTGVQVEHYDRILWRNRVAEFRRHSASLRCGLDVDTPEVGGLPAPTEIVAPERNFGLRILPSPLSFRRICGTLPEGQTIEEIIVTACPLISSGDAIVYLDDELISRERWATVRPRANQLLTIRAIPAGGTNEKKKQNIRTIMSLLIVAGSAWAIGPMAGLLGSKFLGAMAVAGMALGASTALNSLVPMPAPKLESSIKARAQYEITGIGNVANPYGAIPRVYGKIRLFPPLAAQLYIETQGADTYLRMLFCLGYAPLELSEFKLGDTPVENFDLEVKTVEWDDGYELEIYPEAIRETEYSLEVGTDFKTLTTADNVDEAIVDFTFPAGLYQIVNGQREWTHVHIGVQYRRAGIEHASDPWLPDPDYEDLAPSLDEWILEGEATYNAGTGEITFGDHYGAATSPYVYVYFHPGLALSLQSWGLTGATVAEYGCSFFKREGGIFDIFPTTNDAGHPTQGIAEAYGAPGVWRNLTTDIIAGERVELVRIRITNEGNLTPYKIRNVHLSRAETFIVGGGTASLVRRSARLVFPGLDMWDIRFNRYPAYDPDDEDIISLLYVTRILSIHQGAPVLQPGLCLVEMRAKATGQLNGAIDNFNCIAESLLPAWSGTAWGAPVSTSNVAWIYCDMLRGVANRHALADARINLTVMKAWATTCAAWGYKFNGVIDSSVTLYEALKMVAAVGRAEPTFLDGKFSVAVDEYKSSANCPIFTNRNTIEMTVERTFYEIPHALKAKFLNELNGYLEDERVVYDDGYDENGILPAIRATRFEEIELFGVTHPDQVYNECRFRLAELHIRRARYKVRVDAESLTVVRGDRVRVQNDVALWGTCAARIKAVQKIGNDALFTLDETIMMESGKSYEAIIRYADNTQATGYPVTVPGEYNQITLTPWPLALPAVGDLFVFGEHQLSLVDCLVKEIEMHSDYEATLMLIRYEDSIYEPGVIPEYESHITLPPTTRREPNAPVVVQVRSDESVLYHGAGGLLISRILIDVYVPAGGQVVPEYLLVQYCQSGTEQRWIALPPVPVDTREISITGVEDGLAYDIRLCSVSHYGRTSPWTMVEAHTVIGKSTIPPDVTSLYLEQSNFLAWRYPAPPLDLAGFLVRVNDGTNTSWEIGTALTDTPIGESRFSIGTIHGGIKTFLVKAIDVAGNESAGAAWLTFETGAPDEENIIWTEDKRADAFPGVIDNATIVGGNLEATTSTLMWVPGGDPMWTPGTDTFWGADYDALGYETPCKPPNEYLPCRLWLETTIVGLNAILYRVVKAYFHDDFSGTFSTNWNTPTDGTWAIAAGILEVTHNDAGAWHQTSLCKTQLTANATRRYVSLRVKTADASESRFGVNVGGRYCTYQQGTYYIGSVADTISHVMTDNTWEWWLFEITEAGALIWYVNGQKAVVDTVASSTLDFYLVADKRASGTFKYFFDEVCIYAEGGDWRPWLGELPLSNVDELVEIGVSTVASKTQGKITVMRINADVPNIRERFAGVSIAAGGTRLPILKSYRVIKSVIATVVDAGGATSLTPITIDKDAVNGPLAKIINSVNTAVAGIIDVDVEGY